MSSFNINIDELNINVNVNISNNIDNKIFKDTIELLNDKARIIQRFYYNFIKNKNLDDKYFYLHTDEEIEFYGDEYYDRCEYYDSQNDYENEYDYDYSNDKLYGFTDDWEEYYDSIYN